MAMEKMGLVKVIEECGELIQICAKKAAFMGTDIHPDGKRSMTRRISEEMADVLAACLFVQNKMDLDPNFIQKRITEKLELFESWDRIEH